MKNFPNPFQFTTTGKWICLLAILLLVIRLPADEIRLTNGRVLYGQVVRSFGDRVLIQMEPEPGKFPYNRVIPKQDIDKIIDESGLILFENQQWNTMDLTSFFPEKKPDLKSLFVTNTLDTIYSTKGIFIVGKIIDVEEEYFVIKPTKQFLQTSQSTSPFIRIYKENIRKIVTAQGEVKYRKQWNWFKSHPTIYYPAWMLEVSATLIQHNLNNLPEVWREIYQRAPSPLPWEPYPPTVAQEFKFIELSAHFRIHPRFSLGVFTRVVGDTNIYLGGFCARGWHHMGVFHPFLEAGIAIAHIQYKVKYGQDFMLPNSRGWLESITWSASPIAPYLGIGASLKKPGAVGLYVLIRYLPFGEKTTLFLSPAHVEFPKQSKGKLNLSMITATLGLQLGN
jgi:hypothetical protein